MPSYDGFSCCHAVPVTTNPQQAYTRRVAKQKSNQSTTNPSPLRSLSLGTIEIMTATKDEDEYWLGTDKSQNAGVIRTSLKRQSIVDVQTAHQMELAVM